VLTRGFDARGVVLNAFDLEAFDRDAGFFEALGLTFAAGLALALARGAFAFRPFAGDRLAFVTASLALATAAFGFAAALFAFGLAAGFALRAALRGGARLAAAVPRLVVFAMILASCPVSLRLLRAPRSP
jgi:hypothetical protein